MKTVARLLAFLSVVASSLLYVRIRAPINPLRGTLWILRLLAEAMTPFIALSGAVAAGLALLARSPMAIFAGMLGAVAAVRDVRRGGGPPPRLSAGVGGGGGGGIWPAQPDWYVLDKDFFTRPFFRHLAAQGHVVMDVAYRLYPETDMLGMVSDAKRAIAWMKAQGPAYGVNPERVVVAGGSAGGHLALLAAYTPRDGALTPDDVGETDLSVRAVISCYGPTDLRAYYDHTRQNTWGHLGREVEAHPPGPLTRRV